MSSLRALLAATAIAVVGLAAAGASAKPAIPLGPNKLVLKLCFPHYETKTQYLGIKKIGFKFYRVYRITKIHVHANCFKHVVSVHYKYVPLPWFFRKAAPAA